MKTLRFLTLCVCLLVTMMGRAEDFDPARWLRDMPDTMRISQMSIPLAHDAGTYASNSCWTKDQELDERECFNKGVRAFDLRLHGFKDGTFKLAHSSFYYNTFDDELQNHLPTLAQLGDTTVAGDASKKGEFMILYISFENGIEIDYSDYKGSTDGDKWLFEQAYIRELFGRKVLRKLIEHYGKERFIFFRDNLTVKEMRGRIILFVGTNIAPKVYGNYDYENDWIPMNASDMYGKTNSKGEEIWTNGKRTPIVLASVTKINTTPLKGRMTKNRIYSYNEKSCAERYDPNCVTTAKTVISQSYYEDNRKPHVMALYYQWALEKYHSMINIYNTQNYIFMGHINGYKIEEGGVGTAGDDVGLIGKDILGANHRTADYIKSVNKPLGIIGMDFCGTDDDYWPLGKAITSGLSFRHYKLYGETLTKEIVRHNYIQKQMMTEEAYGFVSDVALYITGEKGREQSQDDKAADFFRKKGYKLVTDGSSDVLRNASGQKHRIYIGEKRTMDPDSALTNFVLCYVEPDALEKWKARIKNEGDTIQYLNHKFFSPVQVFQEDVDWNGKVWDGDLRLGLGGNYLYLLKERHPHCAEDKLVKQIKFGWGGDKSKGHLIKSYHVKEDKYGAPEDPRPFPDNTYVCYTAHEHSVSTDLLHNDSIHYNPCKSCGEKFNMTPHSIYGFEKGYNGYEHFMSCKCGAFKTQDCAKWTWFFNTGFGKCTVCNQETWQPAVLKDSVYEISNAGQLYWFSMKTTFDECDANAVLKNDIDFNPDMKVVGDTIINNWVTELREWSPIASCSKEYMEELARVQDYYNIDMSAITAGYKGTFDGQGHVIRGLKLTDKYVNRADSIYYHHGLFGFVHGGTVKNVGIENSYFSSGDYLGSIAGEAQYATIENVYCNSSVINKTNVGPCAGGLIGKFDHTTLKNGYFDGVLSSYADFPIGSGYAGKTISNIYVRKGKYTSRYLDDAIEVPDSFFTSGRLCYLLNDGTYDERAMWRQNIDASDIQPGVYERDTVPVLNRHHSMMVPAVYNGGDFINLHFKKLDDGTNHYYRDGFEVDDKHDFACPIDFSVMNASQTRDMTGYRYGTVCVPFDINVNDNDSIEIYNLSEILTYKGQYGYSILSVDKLPAGTPGIIRKKYLDSNTVTIHCYDGCKVNRSAIGDIFYAKSKYSEDMRLAGTYTDDTIRVSTPWNLFAFNSANDSFEKINDNQALHSRPYRGWVEGLDVQHARLRLFSPTDDIDTVDDEQVNLELPMYDASGRAVVVPLKGQVVIQNGKKTLILKPTNSHLK